MVNGQSLDELWATAWDHPDDEIADAAWQEWKDQMIPRYAPERAQKPVQPPPEDPPMLGQGSLF